MGNAYLKIDNQIAIQKENDIDSHFFRADLNTFEITAISSPIIGTTNSTKDNLNSEQLAIFNGATKLWGITDTGWVVNPNVPSFRVSGSATISVNATGNHKVTWNNDSANNCYNDGNFDTTNSRYTAPISGKYWFATNLRVDGASSYFRMIISKNDSVDYSESLHGIFGNYISTDYQTLVISGSFDLSAGDFVSVYVYSNADTTWDYLPQQSNFSGFLIG